MLQRGTVQRQRPDDRSDHRPVLLKDGWPPQTDGQAELVDLGGWLHSEAVYLTTDGQPSH